MPIHEFRCKKCGRVFEYLCIRSGDKEQAVCPDCGHGQNERLLSTFSSGSAGAAGAGASSCTPRGGFT